MRLVEADVLLNVLEESNSFGKIDIALIKYYVNSSVPQIEALPLGVVRLEIKRLSKLLKVIQDPAKRDELYVQMATLERLISIYEKEGEE